MIPSLSLLRPEWLLALIPLSGFGWWALRIRTGLGDWEQAAKPELLKAMHSLGLVDQQASRGSTMAALVSAALIILALSGPAVEWRDTPSFRNLDAVIFVLDASHSMIEHSNWPKLQAIGRFAISAMGTRPGALILFGGDAYIATDLTTDLRQLGQTFSLVDGETVPDPGSRPERGLALAAQILADARILNGDVILMTDREALLDPSMVEAITRSGARLSIVSIEGTSAQLEELAGAGDGHAFTIEQTDSLVRYLQDRARTVLERQDYPLLYARDVGRYILVLAALPLLILFRRTAG